MGGGFVDDDRQRRLDGVREIADMGARALDDFPVGVDQRVGLARQRRDLDGKFALQPFGAAGADIGDRFRNALQRRKPEADLEDRGQQQHDAERGEGAAEVIIEAAGLVENLAGVAGDADQEFAVGAEIDRALHHPQILALGAIDIAEADAGRGQFGAMLLELRQLLVPQRARRARFGLLGVGAGDLPVPAGQRQFEQRLAERLELVVGRLVRRRDFGDQGAQIEIEPAVEGALGRVAIDRRQHDTGDERGSPPPTRSPTGTTGWRASSRASGHDPEQWRPVSGQDHARNKRVSVSLIQDL